MAKPTIVRDSDMPPLGFIVVGATSIRCPIRPPSNRQAFRKIRFPGSLTVRLHQPQNSNPIGFPAVFNFTSTSSRPRRKFLKALFLLPRRLCSMRPTLLAASSFLTGARDSQPSATESNPSLSLQTANTHSGRVICSGRVRKSACTSRKFFKPGAGSCKVGSPLSIEITHASAS